MGINKQSLKLLLSENSYIPIQGEFLSIGKQTVTIECHQICKLLQENGIDDKNVVDLFSASMFDGQTRHACNSIFDHDLYKSFMDINYNCLDVSEYEGANIVHDMNTPVPSDFEDRFDFIYNGSCMDNIFDPVSFIVNCSRMLKNKGRVLHIEAFSGVLGAYLMYSPEWFFSYYAINGFVDCKVYVCWVNHREKSRLVFDSDLFLWKPYFKRNPDINYYDVAKKLEGYLLCLVIAEKGASSTCEKKPIQMQYLNSGETDWRIMWDRYSKSARPIMTSKKRKKCVRLPFDSDHHVYLGSNF